MGSLASLWLLGLLLGMRHATDADHVVAVSTIASRERCLRSALLVGVSWGLGHALSVMVMGGAIVALGLAIPPRFGLGLEFFVALALIGLGLVNLRAPRAVAHAAHPLHASTFSHGSVRSLGIGLLHGLAGSAGIALLVLASIHSPRAAFGYLAIFGLGTIIGMVLLTFVLALPVAYAAQRCVRAHRELARVAGLLSVALGLFLVYRIGFVDGLFVGAAPHAVQ